MRSDPQAEHASPLSLMEIASRMQKIVLQAGQMYAVPITRFLHRPHVRSGFLADTM